MLSPVGKSLKDMAWDEWGSNMCFRMMKDIYPIYERGCKGTHKCHVWNLSVCRNPCSIQYWSIAVRGWLGRLHNCDSRRPCIGILEVVKIRKQMFFPNRFELHWVEILQVLQCSLRITSSLGELIFWEETKTIWYDMQAKNDKEFTDQSFPIFPIDKMMSTSLTFDMCDVFNKMLLAVTLHFKTAWSYTVLMGL